MSVRQTITSVWMLSREYGTIAGAGGVKDVVAQLSRALARWNGRKVSVVLPRYGFIDPAGIGFALLPDPARPTRPLQFGVDMNYTGRERLEQVRVWRGVRDRVTVYLLEAERFSEKGGVYTYTRKEYQRESWKVQGAGHFDYFAMNTLLQKAALELMIILDHRPQIIHCHDGHTAVVPALMRECPGYRSYFRSSVPVVTIHNAGVGYHQEVSDLPFVQAVTGLPMHVVERSCLDGSFDPFIAAGHYATLTTVSENYARELQQTDDDYLTGWLGHRLGDHGVEIVGITNGIDPADFDPREPEKTGIASGYDVAAAADELPGKQRCKQALLGEVAARLADEEERAGFLDGDRRLPLFAFVGRLSGQKGVDILLGAVEIFLADRDRGQLICLGSGADRDEEALCRLTRDPRFAGRVCFLRGFDPLMANRLYAAADFFVIPSRYEPCGLTDFIAQLFGTIPVVHHVGGLVKVIDGETGLAYSDNSAEQCAEALVRASTLFFEDPSAVRRMQRRAVELICGRFTWNEVVKAYVSLYRQSLKALAAG